MILKDFGQSFRVSVDLSDPIQVMRDGSTSRRYLHLLTFAQKWGILIMPFNTKGPSCNYLILRRRKQLMG